MTNSSLKFHLFLLLFFTPVFAGAQISFSEIMYDPEGSDTGREWVEIYNGGSSQVDISAYKFAEGGTNHGLTVVDGGGVVLGNGYAVIAGDPAKFKKDFPSFNGVLFDSSFSLKNDSETLYLKDKNLITLDSVTYSSEAGATGDGKSLQKINNDWMAKAPTPGSADLNDSLDSAIGTIPNNQVIDSTSSAPVKSVVSNFPVEPQMIVEAGVNKTTVAGAVVSFNGIALGLKKEPIENAQYMWSFGDGAFKDGRNVTHTYRYPGEYIVVLEASSGYFSGSDRVKVSVINPEIIISKIGDSSDYFIEVTNSSKYELDLSGWILRSQNAQFFIPKNTIIMSGGKVSFSSLVTGFSFSSGDKPSLLYPSGATAVTFGDPVVVAIKKETNETSNANVVAVVKEVEERGFSGKNMMASVASASSGGENEPLKQNQTFPVKWLLAVGALSILAVLGIMFSGTSSGKKSDELSADDFEIEEDID